MAEAPEHSADSELSEAPLGDPDIGVPTHQNEEPEAPQEAWSEDGATNTQHKDGAELEVLGQPELPKASTVPDPEEDEGFSDCTQKPEPLRQPPWGSGEPKAGGPPSPHEIPEKEPERPHQFSCEDEEREARSPEDQGSAPCREPQMLSCSDEETHEQNPQQTPASSTWDQGPELGSPPLSPNTTLLHRTESLNRAVERSHSVKKAQPALPVSKIDERLEQYTQAVESSGRTPRLTRQTSIELPSEAVASTKNRWETGQVQTPAEPRTSVCKDIVAGDMSLKQLWEANSSPAGTRPAGKVTPSGKRYKFVATGHGKYEKVPVDQDSG